MFESLGVDPTLELVYLALLKIPNAGIAALAQETALTEDAVRAAMDDLARLALLRPSLDTPGMLRPVSPAIGLESLFARQRADLFARQRDLEGSRAELEVLVADYMSQQPDSQPDLTVELTGLDAARDYLEQLAYRTRFEVLSMMPDGPQTTENLEASEPLDAILLARGVDIKSLYLESVRNDPASVSYARWMHERGGQVRVAPVLPLRMILIDRETAVVPMDPASSSHGISVVRSPGAVSAMQALWDRVWESASVFGGSQVSDDQTLSDTERELLRLLAQGNTDEAAARKLGVSSRTVGRIVSELTDRLGARSRFQAGVRAAERGWLAPRTPAGEGPETTLEPTRPDMPSEPHR
jgi:DNA-binding CsgD family transcriptional regulator